MIWLRINSLWIVVVLCLEFSVQGAANKSLLGCDAECELALAVPREHLYFATNLLCIAPQYITISMIFMEFYFASIDPHIITNTKNNTRDL